MIVAFVFLAAMTLISALGVVLSRNVVHSALFMSASFFGIAGFFVMLNAPVLAAFQVLIYVGAVTVVILFGIMFTQRPQVRRFRTIIQRQHWPGLFVAIGAWGALIRRNAVVVFMCIELMLNAVNLSLVAFADYLPDAGGAGAGYAVLVIAVAAAEIAVGLAVVLAVYRTRRTVNVDEVNLMKG